MYQFVLRYFDNVDVSNPCVKFKFVPNPIFFPVFPVAWTGYSFALSRTASAAATRNAAVASGDALPTTAFTAIALPSFPRPPTAWKRTTLRTLECVGALPPPLRRRRGGGGGGRRAIPLCVAAAASYAFSRVIEEGRRRNGGK